MRRAVYFLPDGGLVAQAGGRHAFHGRPARARWQRLPPKPVDLGAAVITGLNTNRNQTGWVWLAESGGQPMKLCYAPTLGDAMHGARDPELAPANLRSVEPQLVHWKSGPFTVEGLLYHAPDAAAAKVPLIVDVHGGPFGAWENRNDRLRGLPHRPRLGRAAAQSARLVQLRRRSLPRPTRTTSVAATTRM